MDYILEEIIFVPQITQEVELTDDSHIGYRIGENWWLAVRFYGQRFIYIIDFKEGKTKQIAFPYVPIQLLAPPNIAKYKAFGKWKSENFYDNVAPVRDTELPRSFFVVLTQNDLNVITVLNDGANFYITSKQLTGGSKKPCAAFSI